MRPTSSRFKKRVAHFFLLASNITLIASIVMFFVCMIEDIPLRYMSGFILAYIVTSILSALLAEKKGIGTREDGDTKNNILLLYTIANIASFGLILILTKRYGLQEYILPIILCSITLINLMIAEFHKKIFSRFFSTKGGIWILRTCILFVLGGGSIYAYNTLMQSPSDISISGVAQKTRSETTGTLSTIDTSSQKIYDIKTESNIENNDTPRQEGIISGDIDSYQKSETLGTITTEGEQNVTIDSIQSMNGNASARIQDGKIVVEVIPANTTPRDDNIINNTDNMSQKTAWSIEGIVDGIGNGKGLQGVVISGPVSSTPSGEYAQYQNIKLSAEGASGIFFTIDGTTPTCSGEGTNNIATVQKSITIKAISCFGGNKIRGPVSVFSYSIP